MLAVRQPVNDGATSPPTTPNRRRWLQFGLQTLLMVMLIVRVPLSHLRRVIQAREQPKAVAA
jgi:hypothetical protein